MLNPSTWSLIRRTKDNQGRFIVNPDPTVADGSSLWGVHVTVTTTMPAGQALVMDGRRAGEAIVRNGLIVQADYGQQGFEYNQTTLRCEERLAVYSPYPAAMCLVSNITS